MPPTTLGFSRPKSWSITDLSYQHALQATQPIGDPTDPAKTAKQDQAVYSFTDGTLIRVKPKGDRENAGKVMYSVEVKTATPAPGQDGVAFKVDAEGRAVPKGTGDTNNPYNAGTNKPQFRAYQDDVMSAGHKVGQ